MAFKSNGFVLWEGSSLVDGQDIAVIVTGIKNRSTNIKTGAMLQSYIICKDIHPVEALLSEKDYSICCNCPLRKSICYVDLLGVGKVYSTYKKGKYPHVTPEILAIVKAQKEFLRFGAYGDPAVIPIKVWQPLLENVIGYTGYTHQFRESFCDPEWKNLIMASVETVDQKQQANSMGWRTFRIIGEGEKPLPDEIFCKNYLDKRIKCELCLLCNGGIGKNIVVPVHGLKHKINSFNAMRNKLTTQKFSDAGVL